MLDPAATPWLKAISRLMDNQQGHCEAGDFRVDRIAGGWNNALFRIESRGQVFACKLCVPDDRQRARREFAALELLWQAGLDLAPQPLWLDESCRLVPYPAVAYSWLDGQPVDAPFDPAQLAVFLDTFQQMHTCRPSSSKTEVLPAWFHWLDFGPYRQELEQFQADYGAWLAAQGEHGAHLAGRLAKIHRRAVAALSESAMFALPGRTTCLCRVDANRKNLIWRKAGRPRWVDWEYSGWGDPALEIAELRWHAALEDLGIDAHIWLRQKYRPEPRDLHFYRRMHTYDCLLSARWSYLILRRLWSQVNGPDRTRLGYAEIDSEPLWNLLETNISRSEEFWRNEG